MRALAMTGMRDRVHDPLDHRRVAHAGDAAGRADVGRHALERHDGDGAGVLGDLRLLGGDDVHDDAALEHLGEALLGRPGGRFDGHVLVILWSVSRSVRRPGLAPGSSPVRVDRAPRARRLWHERPRGHAKRPRRGAGNAYCRRECGSAVMSVGKTDQANALTGVSSQRPPWAQCDALASYRPAALYFA